MDSASSRLQVKNKAPAAVQITAEQIIREAKERELEVLPPPPKQKISDPTELKDYQLRKRKEFEDNLRKNRTNTSHWLKYATWEDSQGDIERARSVFERALDVTGSKNITIWLLYIEMEIKKRQIKHARTLFDRAVKILPRVNQFWYKFVYFEEKLGNIPSCREVFERWMKFLPGEQEWQTYINFEMRYKEYDRARMIHARYVMLHPDPKNWVKFARFEERHSSPENARQVFEVAFEFFNDQDIDETLFISFAQFEERQHEYDRVKLIYDYALNKLPKDKAPKLYENFSLFQKKYGAQKDIESLIWHKRKLLYEENLAKHPHDYDTWFDYLKLAEDGFTLDECRDLYERAVAFVPKSRKNKDAWRRYIYLWIYYAIFEELVAKDKEKAFKIYEFCIDNLIPHKTFTFAKLWLYAAKLQIRMGNIDKARDILNKSLKRCPKRKLFHQYIELEIQLREFNNCRQLYSQFLQRAPHDSLVWINFAELESILGETERARAIYESAIGNERIELDSPENVWKAYIDFELEQEEYDKVKQLYRRLLKKTNQVKVWISYAQFHEDLEEFSEARKVFEQANDKLREEEPLARVVLLECWQKFEQRRGEDGLDISNKMPTKVKKRKRLDDEDDWIEYYEYVFPDGDTKKSGLMDRVKRWKQQSTANE